MLVLLSIDYTSMCLLLAYLSRSQLWYVLYMNFVCYNTSHETSRPNVVPERAAAVKSVVYLKCSEIDYYASMGKTSIYLDPLFFKKKLKRKGLDRTKCATTNYIISIEVTYEHREKWIAPTSVNSALMNRDLKFTWKNAGTQGWDPSHQVANSKAVLVGHLVYFTGSKGRRGGVGQILDLNRRVWTPIFSVGRSQSFWFHSATLVNDSIVLIEVGQRPMIYSLDLVLEEIRILPTFGDVPLEVGFHSADLYENKNQLVCLGSLSSKREDTVRILHLRNMRWQIVNTKGKKSYFELEHGSCIVKHSLFVLDGDGRFVLYILRLDNPQCYQWSAVQPLEGKTCYGFTRLCGPVQLW